MTLRSSPESTGPATLPRWFRIEDRAPAGSQASCQVTVNAELVARLDPVAAELGVRPPDLLLAAHLGVLRAITSQQEPATLLVDADGVRLAGGAGFAGGQWPDGSWADLVAAAAATRLARPAPRPGAETELDLTAFLGGTPPTEHLLSRDTVLRVAPGWVANQLVVRLAHRPDLIERDYVQRVAGYLLRAVRLILTEPHSSVSAQALLAPAELDELLHAHRGPDRPLPDELFPQLFALRVAMHPDVIAATHRDQQWSYAELDRHAGRLAAALLAAGLQDEDVVAVVADRGLPWLAATLAVLRAGGVYLPIRPDFPAARVATQLARAAVRFAIVDDAGDSSLKAACAASAEPFTIHLSRVPPGPGAQPRAVRPDQLAYIYFTSGSTGTPKGVMCEHAGMLNHLLMKVDDLELAAGDTVTQTASQCFDISLWQLLAPLLVGGHTLIVDVADQLDVAQFVALLAAGGIEVVQLVPAYLDVLVDHLQRNPAKLGDLRRVSVTGEALKYPLVQRWFALFPGIPLVNAYGATEVSDDTMHAILDAPPVRGSVPVGTSLRNVGTYIVDEQLRLVPTGAPGEIVFSGICVGRGYVNDPDRTAEAFTLDPWRPGERLYRTGDFGRWLPEGTIEFLGRRDEQVKVRGYRIEIGEIENRLALVPGVTDCAVVLDGAEDTSRNLVAFYTGSPDLQVADLVDFLAATLPDYMVPPYLHRLPKLPLTENGKIDKRALLAVAGVTVQAAPAFASPTTPTQRRLATAWAEVLGVLVGQVGLDDNFFALGGTSLSAVRLVVQLDRTITLRQLTSAPTIRQLAAMIEESSPAAGRPARTLLQPLATAGSDASATLVCFPYAAGNAVNFRPLALELSRSGFAVLGAELPGHDVAVRDEALLDVATIAKLALAELADSTGPLLIWGHCAGAAPALELAHLLAAAGRPAERVFLGSPPFVYPPDVRAERARVQALSNRELTTALRDSSAYVEFDLLQDERGDLVGRAYRHDVCAAADYLLAERPRLQAPVELIVAGDQDPTGLVGQWSRIAADVSLHQLECDGEYFIRTAAASAARTVLRACPRYACSTAS
ncbi:amino acid adenylation domain-containing protein [Jatrophihabitans sp.]|uniref:amino acid adenylation domain-containing protein n=1 Tax=Jatrophihabitans sp. TaxID=1932789 RepID=UPI002F23958A